MKKTIILLVGIFILCLSGLIAQSAAIERSTFNNALLIQENDPDLNIEKWMVNSKYWDWATSDNNAASIAEENDEALELENWMTQNCYWN